MATTTFGVNHPLSNKLWARKLAHEFFGENYLSRFMGFGDNDMIRVLDEPSKMAGDRVTYGLRRKLSGAGQTEGETLEGNEEAMNFDDDSLVINELAHAVRFNRRMTTQRVAYNLRSEAKSGLKDWFLNRTEVAGFNHLVGNTEISDVKYTGFNAVTAPTAAYHIFATGADDDAVGADDTAIMDLDLISAAKQRLVISDKARPIRYRGGNWWLFFMHPFQELQLKRNTASGQWLDIQKAQLMGSGSDDNNIFTGSLGVFDNVILHSSQNSPLGVGAGGAVSTTRRGVMCGANALHVAFGQGYSDGDKWKWVEDEFDYERNLGVSAQTIMGMKKTVYNSTDYATCVVSTYGAAV